YAVGRTGFRALDLKLDRRALIPRPETEGLVELVLEWGRGEGGRGTGGVAADIGTGCGCIAVSLAVEGRFDRVIGVAGSAGAASGFTTTCSAGRATRWRSHGRTRDRRESAGVGAAARTERRIQGAEAGQRAAARGRGMPHQARRAGAARRGARARGRRGER